MTLLWNKYRGKDWFEAATSYCSTRFFSVENRLLIALRYVTMHKDNRRTFSYEFASVLRDCGSVFGSVMDAILKGSQGIKKSETNIADYRDFLRIEDGDIYKRTLQVRSCFPAGIIVPFEEFREPKGVPDWWNAYNNVKHSEYDEYGAGNLENCVTAMAALALLGFFMSWFVSDQLFVNVGIAYDEKSIDMSTERRLFPHTSA